MNSRILLVEDSVLILEMYAAYFRPRNFEIYVAASAEEGWEVFRRLQDKVELVITDGQLPNEPGPWLAKKIREISSVPILLVSGHVARYSEHPGYECVSGILHKPFGTNELTEALEKFLDPAVLREA